MIIQEIILKYVSEITVEFILLLFIEVMNNKYRTVTFTASEKTFNAVLTCLAK